MNKLFSILLTIVLASCGKEDISIPQEYIDRAESFKASIQTGGFVLVDYYSEEPTDYDQDGETETDLNKFVSEWLKDDTNHFSGENVAVIQGKMKIPTDPSDSIVRPYLIKADKDGVFLDFLSHEYLPLRYRLVSHSTDEFIVFAEWMGGVVYSRFKRVTF